jgi:GNAT superfamily N-acetyltransferase
VTVVYRAGSAGDALSVSGLATYVFFDTYITDGIRDDFVREAFSVYSPAAFEARLTDPAVASIVAHEDGHLVGFADIHRATPCPVERVRSSLELVHLYVHPRFHRRGIGAQLLTRAESLGPLWLSAWSGNANALAFYTARGYAVAGTVDHVIEGIAYENKVLARP